MKNKVGRPKKTVDENIRYHIGDEDYGMSICIQTTAWTVSGYGSLDDLQAIIDRLKAKKNQPI